MAAKLATPPDGVTTVETGDVGSAVEAGPSTLAGVVVVQIGLTSAAVGAAGLPGICGAADPLPNRGTMTAARDATTTSVAAAIASKAFPDGNLPDASWSVEVRLTAPPAWRRSHGDRVTPG